jgi:hypothetical protein
MDIEIVAIAMDGDSPPCDRAVVVQTAADQANKVDKIAKVTLQKTIELNIDCIHMVATRFW